jgi:hypothetical protein
VRGARVVRVVAATLAAVAFVAGSGNLLRLTDIEHTESAIYLGLADREDGSPIPALHFIVTATSLNAVERRLQTTVKLMTRTRDRSPMSVDSNGKSVEESGVIRPEFADAKLKVVLSSAFFGETTVLYPLANVIDPLGPKDALSVTASVPVDVDPTQFPNDSYSLDLYVWTSLPAGIYATALRNEGNASAPTMTTIPAIFGIALDDRLGQWSLVTEEIIAGPRNAHIKAEFSRGWAYWAFVYSVSLMPAVIGLSFFVRTRRRRGVSAGDTSSAMELAAALLALIALRQVFVPTDIVGLTRLDFLLGVQLLAVCWLMAVTYVAEPPASPPTARKPSARRRRLVPQMPNGAVRRVT